MPSLLSLECCFKAFKNAIKGRPKLFESLSLNAKNQYAKNYEEILQEFKGDKSISPQVRAQGVPVMQPKDSSYLRQDNNQVQQQSSLLRSSRFINNQDAKGGMQR